MFSFIKQAKLKLKYNTEFYYILFSGNKKVLTLLKPIIQPMFKLDHHPTKYVNALVFGRIYFLKF